mmetsp:Transcript_54449/g.108419  ORF Transcript_54449/g.108419 Transcript_54449/m.108419 type:complete len:242 (-) Transcript_54449:28-753(-)
MRAFTSFQLSIVLNDSVLWTDLNESVLRTLLRTHSVSAASSPSESPVTSLRLSRCTIDGLLADLLKLLGKSSVSAAVLEAELRVVTICWFTIFSSDGLLWDLLGQSSVSMAVLAVELLELIAFVTSCWFSTFSIDSLFWDGTGEPPVSVVLPWATSRPSRRATEALTICLLARDSTEDLRGVSRVCSASSEVSLAMLGTGEKAIHLSDMCRNNARDSSECRLSEFYSTRDCNAAVPRRMGW